jgi:Tfp pilus assembly protein PilX
MSSQYRVSQPSLRGPIGPLREESGAILIVALLILLALSLLGVAGITTSTTEFQIAGNQYRGNQAVTAADAGAEQVMAYIRANPSNAMQGNLVVLPMAGAFGPPTNETYSVGASAVTVRHIKTSTLSEDPSQAMSTDFERRYYEVRPIVGTAPNGATRNLVVGYSVYGKRS